MLLCQLGSHPQLSQAELESVFGIDQVTELNHGVAIIEPQSDITPDQIQATLGGTVKIAKPIVFQKELKEEEILQSIVEFLLEQASEKVEFAIAEFNRDHLPKLELHKIKKLLSQKTTKTIRYIEGSRTGLSASILLHHPEINEIWVCRDREGRSYLAQTVTVQDIDTWTVRDRGKPEVERKRGLLPPKLARIMLNLALGKNTFELDRTKTQPALLDPFCGIGTIPLEALALGLSQIWGSDLDPEAVAQSGLNLKWYENEVATATQITEGVKFLTADATQLDQVLPKDSMSLIVTEPFLGKQTPDLHKIGDIAKGLERLYLGAFKSWQTILKPHAKIVIIFPNWSQLRQPYSWQNLLQKLATFGYHQTGKTLEYARPGARVIREIWQFELHK